jgi:hypothetical protein
MTLPPAPSRRKVITPNFVTLFEKVPLEHRQDLAALLAVSVCGKNTKCGTNLVTAA